MATYFNSNFMDRVCMPISVVVQSKAWVFGCSLTGIAGSNPTGDMHICLLLV
jgi:hypothetical protein